MRSSRSTSLRKGVSPAQWALVRTTQKTEFLRSNAIWQNLDFLDLASWVVPWRNGFCKLVTKLRSGPIARARRRHLEAKLAQRHERSPKRATASSFVSATQQCRAK